MRTEAAFASAADLAACEKLLRDGSRTFYAASRVLPPGVRTRAIALYAFCRVADDAVDSSSKTDDSVERLRARLDAIYRSRPQPTAVDRAFAGLVDDVGIPRALPLALLEGFEWDLRARRYQTLADLQEYAARVAGSVGVMMALIMGVRAAPVLARAADLGVAMQLTNIARDVGEDARAGRLYLPIDWLHEAGIESERWLLGPVFNDALAFVIERMLCAADHLYRRAAEGVAALPLACQPAMHAARLLYAEIGHQVRRHQHDSVSRRAVVPARRKAWGIAAALAISAMPLHAARASAALDQTQFLIDAAALPQPAPKLAIIEAKVQGVVDLFSRLALRDQAAAYDMQSRSR